MRQQYNQITDKCDSMFEYVYIMCTNLRDKMLGKNITIMVVVTKVHHQNIVQDTNETSINWSVMSSFTITIVALPSNVSSY